MADDQQAPLLGRAGRARNFKYTHPRKSPTRTRIALATVLLTETFERIAFYGIVANLVMFLNASPFDWTFYNATNAHFIFTGASYITSILGGWIADSFLGKFKTICLGFVIYIGGFMFFPFLAPNPYLHTNHTEAPSWCKQPMNISWHNVHNSSHTGHHHHHTPEISPGSETCAWAVYLALSVVAIANGIVKANISPFGAEQVKHEGPAAIRMFVNWFYWCINIGALVSVGGLAYLQQEYNFFWGYIIPNICLVISFIVFLLGSCFYIRKPAEGSILTNIVKVLCESCKMSCRQKTNNEDLTNSEDQNLDTAPSCIDCAKVSYGGSYHDNMVDDVKTLLKICVMFLAMVPYWVVYFQMETTFLVQGLHMKLDFRTNGTKAAAAARPFKIPVAWLSLFDVVFLIILLPLFDRVIYPCLQRRGHVLSPRFRIFVGMLFSMAAVLVAGGVEMYRMNVYKGNGTHHVHWQLIGTTYYQAADVTVLLQIPQYALIGISEVFASVAGLELAYVLAPKSMQGLITGLFWLTQGVGSIIGTVIILSFRGVWFYSWDHGDISPGPCAEDISKTCSPHLDYYFFFLAGLQLVGLVLFALVIWCLDIGAVSAYDRRLPLEEPLSGSGDSQGGSTRHSYSTFRQPRRGLAYRANAREASETDTLDTDANVYG